MSEAWDRVPCCKKVVFKAVGVGRWSGKKRGGGGAEESWESIEPNI